MAKLDGLSQKLDDFIASGAHSSHNPSNICAIYSSPAHPTQSCPSSASYLELIEDLNVIQNF